MKHLKTYETLEERTINSFKNWYIKFNTIITDEDYHKYESELKAWQIYKPYFNNKDIFSYKNFEDYQKELDKAKQKFYSKLKNIYEGVDYDTIYEDDNVKIIVPLTLNGSCKYGYNTKWCTSMMERPEHFTKYIRSGVLYRFLFKNDIKFSLHWANNGNKFFRDQLDNELTIKNNNSFVLLNTPFELNKEAKKKVSIDYITRKWNSVFVKDWRKKYKNIKSLSDYKRYIDFEFDDNL